MRVARFPGVRGLLAVLVAAAAAALVPSPVTAKEEAHKLLKGFERTDEDLRQEVPIPYRYHAWHLAGRVVGPVAYGRSRLAWRH